MPVATWAGCLFLTTNKTKIQTQSSASWITISLNIAHQSKNRQTNKHKLHTNITLYKAYTNNWTNFRRAETKGKKEFNPEAWEKESLNTILKK